MGDGYSGDGITCDQQTAVWLLYDIEGENIGHANQDGIFTDVRGGLDQVEVGEFGVFGVNTSYKYLYYKKGTHNNPYAIGPNVGGGWHHIGTGFKYVSSGRDTAIAISQTDEIWSLENVSVQDSGEIQYGWFKINGALKSISVH